MRLDVQDLSCGHGNTIVVEGFTAAVEAGTVMCLLGPNGVGKTTLFRTILGLLPAKAGRVRMGGKDLATMSRTQAAKLLGYVPQSAHTPFAFRVLDVVAMGRTAYLGVLGRPTAADMQLGREALDRLHAGHLADALFTELSGGERQLVMIARAIVQQPAFVMLDEPTASLDFGNQVRVLREVVALAESGIGVVMTTHTPTMSSSAAPTSSCWSTAGRS